MIAVKRSGIFHVEPASWLGLRLDTGRQEIWSVKAALVCECKPNKGDKLRIDLEEALSEERGTIEKLPDVGNALQGDSVEKARASECRAEQSPSVDIYIGRAEDVLLVECKYKACPETQIVKSADAFRFCVARKFDKSVAFLEQQGAKVLSPDRIVLFNTESRDKAISMFKRLQLQEEESQEFAVYCLMDTAEFWSRYMV